MLTFVVITNYSSFKLVYCIQITLNERKKKYLGIFDANKQRK